MSLKHLTDTNLDLWSACQTHGATLNGLLTHNGEPVRGDLLLWAISGLESSFGRMAMFVRQEPAYAPNGVYYHRSPELRSLWQVYGVLAASSFGAFQLMYVVAYELGFMGHPIALQEHDTCARYATTLIRDRFIQRQQATTLTQVLDAYNTGNWRDGNIPQPYVTRGIMLYETELL